MRLVTRTLLAALLLIQTHSLAREPMITAHRGASFDAPENTLSAFELAWKQGADAIEADFYLSSDDQIVCIHDKDTMRTAGVKKIVEKTSLEDLRALEYGGWKDKSFQGEPIPTFEQVLAAVPAGKTFVIELKTGARIVPVLVNELKRLAPPQASLLIISFDAPSIAMCKQLLPNVKAHWLTGFKEDKSGAMKPTAAEIAKTVRDTNADGVGMKGEVTVIDQSFIDSLLNDGCGEFHVWTIDDANHAKLFKSLGAVGITTNKPGYIRSEIEKL